MLDVSYPGAFVAGLLSFLTPCILPIVPFYLGYLGGTSVHQVMREGTIQPDARKRAVVSAVIFSAGVITVFVGLGASSSLLGQFFRQYFDFLRWIAAGLIGIMGLHFLGVIRIAVLHRQFRLDDTGASHSGYLGAYLMGLAFAFGWTPCVGPVLAAILFVAAGTETAGDGARLLMVYGLGMTLPFMLAALFVVPFMRWMAGFRPCLPYVEKATGAFLILFAVMVGTNSMNIVAEWMLEVFPAFATIG